MHLIINGQEMDVVIESCTRDHVETHCNASLPTNIVTIVDLFTHLKLIPDQTAVEKNGIIIDKSAYESEQVTEGDHLELIRFMGGGRC